MIPPRIFRSFHTNIILRAANKLLLSKLRKKTGYTFINCKKALELHNDDFEKAEQWLKDEAQKQGWEQATKLKSRLTTQGLVALRVNNNHGVLVEINCETDFVARNKKFHDLTETIVNALLQYGKTIEAKEKINKTILYTDAMQALPAADGKCLADHSALTIGAIGENINLRRALCMSVHPSIKLFGCTHPSPINPVPVSFGKYGALVALKCKGNDNNLGTQLCQHVIGMNPVRIGDPNVDEPHTESDNETLMLFQEFLFDPAISVQQLLINEQATLIDFTRFEMGEVLAEDKELNSVETCG